jgi:hypothetical protein
MKAIVKNTSLVLGVLLIACTAQAYTFRFYNMTDKEIALEIPCSQYSKDWILIKEEEPIKITLQSAQFKDIDYSKLNCYPEIAMIKINGSLDGTVFSQVSLQEQMQPGKQGETVILGKNNGISAVEGLLNEQEARIEDAKRQPVTPNILTIELNSAFKDSFNQKLETLKSKAKLAEAPAVQFTVQEFKKPYNLPTTYVLVGTYKGFPFIHTLLSTEKDPSATLLFIGKSGEKSFYINQKLFDNITEDLEFQLPRFERFHSEHK